ncbi:MAG: pyrroloquinoline quinone biosynthesis peptide chaperone PqqD [SAR86 cluster bacterium]|uniref:Pyrroloquinoline quinone biosynthesis peptide chaperone PqqD n=1 Tax=SAR86 cluster bacterium TaxID=2030880 RepID=A0A2A4XAY1_9GAMM|nr:MAG: pyrroloquinoline quinone biosynthesis peptide chaperone PqqD [SAR86 cluster bacterium]
MSEFNLETASFKLNPRYQFQWEEAQQCHVLLYPEGLIKLSGSAAEILQRCQAPTTTATLVNELNKAFPGAEGLTDDVNEFLADAQQQVWIVQVSD